MEVSTASYIAIVFFILAINVWLLIRFLIKASRWKDDPDG
jgi:hypothetical protein